MAKQESTAVNELIHRVATMKPLVPDPADDIMFSPPRAVQPQPQTPRRTRAANGTPSAAMTMQGLGAPPVPPAGKPTAATMQGLGPVVQRALSSTPPLPRSVDDGWTMTPVPVAAPARQSSRREAQSSQSMPAVPPPPLPSQSQSQSMKTPLPARHVTPVPRSMPVAAPFESGGMPAASRSMTRGHAVEAGAAEVAPTRAWFEKAHERFEQGPDRLEEIPHEETWVGTMQLHRPPTWGALIGKVIAPIVVLVVAGVLVVGYFVFDGRGGKSSAPAAPAAVATAVQAPAAQVVVEPVPAAPAVKAAEPAPSPAAVPSKFVDVVLVSSPAGATVTLVDRGKTTFIGTTPVATALDPSRRYELIFSHPSLPTHVESIDPSTTHRVDVKLGQAARAESPRPAAARPRTESRVEQAAAPAPEKVVAEKAPAAPAGDGILMIASKPPCEIVIDGKPTGLMTPQREIPLAVGGHKVTLVNKSEDISKTISVQISAGKPTKVIQDLMQQE